MIQYNNIQIHEVCDKSRIDSLYLSGIYHKCLEDSVFGSLKQSTSLYDERDRFNLQIKHGFGVPCSQDIQRFVPLEVWQKESLQ